MDKKLELSLITKLVDKFSGPAKKMGGATKFVTQRLRETNKAVKENNKLISKVDDLKKRQKAFEDLNDKIKLHQRNLTKLQGQRKQATGSTNKLNKAISKQHKELIRLNGSMKKQNGQMVRSGGLIEKQRNKISALKVELHKADIYYGNTTKAQRKMADSTDRLNDKLERQKRIAGTMAKLSSKWQGFKRGARRAAAVGAIAAGITGTAFAQQESASIDLEIALMDKSGNTPAQLEKINAIAEKLGNKLPGTTADFFQAARALSEQGVSQDVIANGGLAAASNLAVLLDRSPAVMAEMVAKNREAFGLQNDELMKMADLTQRTKFAFGLNPEAMQEANAQMGTQLREMNLTGYDNAKKIMILEGLSAQLSKEGGNFGTSLKELLKETAFVKDNLSKKGFEDVQKLLDNKGIKLDFYNEDGSFSGIDNMVIQLEKMAGLSDIDRTKVLTKLFKARGMQLASIIAKQGKKGFKEAEHLLDQQASLTQRIVKKTDGFGAHIEALTGSLTTLSATFFKPIGDGLKPIIRDVNELIGSVDQWLKKDEEIGGLSAKNLGGAYDPHNTSFFENWSKGAKTAIRVVAALASVYLTWRGILLTSRIALGALSGGLPGATAAFVAHFAGIKKFASLIPYVIGVAIRSLKLLALVLRANPIIALLSAIAYAAWLIYDNWDAVVRGVKKMWNGLTADFQQLLNDFKQKPITTLASLPMWFSNLGKNMIINLIDGIFSIDIKAKMRKLITDMKESFKGFSLFGKGLTNNRPLSRVHQKSNKLYNLNSGMGKLSAAALATSLAMPAQAQIAQPAKRIAKQPIVMTDNSRVVVNINAPAGLDEKGVAKMVVEGIRQEKWKSKQSAKSSYSDED